MGNLFYNYFRDYDPVTGRYLESDPIGLDGGLNTYGYANANSAMFNDPTGLFAPALGWAICEGGGCAAAAGLITNSIAGGIAIYNMPDKSDAAARQTEYSRAKNFCDTPPPQGSNDCSTLSKQIDHAEQCINLYEAWDKKWLPGRHSQKIQTWRNRLQNLKDKHKSECTNKCL